MMHGHEKSDLVIVAMKPANKAKEAHCGSVCGGERSGVCAGGAAMHQHNTYWTQSQARVTNALERIRPLSPSHTRGGSRMRESRTYGSGRGACDETHVPWRSEMLAPALEARRHIVGCCARSTTGHATAEQPSSAMNSRRLMRNMGAPSHGCRRRPYQLGPPLAQSVCRTSSLSAQRSAGPWGRPKSY